MILSLSITILLFSPVLMFILHRWRPRSGLPWLLCSIIALFSWLTVLLSRLQMPAIAGLRVGEVSVLFSYHLSFRLDKISWPFALTLMVLLAAFLLTSVTQLPEVNNNPRSWSVWPFACFVAGLGLLSLVAGNLFTLLLTWAAIDLSWLAIKLAGDSPRQGIQLGFALRVLGIFVAIAALLSKPGGGEFIFPIMNTQTNTLLFIAALIRLTAIIPVPQPTQNNYPWLGFNRFLDILLFSTAFVTISRTADPGISNQFTPFILALTALVGLVSALIWVITKTQISWKNLFVGFSTLSIAGALLSGYEASMAWSLALLLAVSLPYYCVYTTRIFKGIFLVGLIGISGFPFTPAWQGIQIYPLPGEAFTQGAWWIIFFLAQVLFLVGYLITWSISRKSAIETERWSAIVYPAGLILMPVTQFIILIWGVPGISNDLQAFPDLILVWAPIAAMIIAGASLSIWNRSEKLQTRAIVSMQNIQILEPANKIGDSINRLAAQLVRIIERILEGEGGILWTMLFLMLLFALLISINFGG